VGLLVTAGVRDAMFHIATMPGPAVTATIMSRVESDLRPTVYISVSGHPTSYSHPSAVRRRAIVLLEATRLAQQTCAIADSSCPLNAHARSQPK